MKKKYLIQVFIIFLLLTSSVFAIQGDASDGSVTAKNGGMGATAAAASGSDVSGRVSAGGSGVSSSYSGEGVSGSPGADLSTSDSTTDAGTGSGTQTGTTTSAGGGLNSIPSGGGGGGGGATSDGSDATAETVETTTETSEATEATETNKETETVAAENAITVAIVVSEGASITLAPQTGAASMSVIAVTASTATIVVTSVSAGNAVTGAVVYNTDQEVTMDVGQTIDVDSDNNGIADLQVTLTRIEYNSETGKYEGVFTLTYLTPTDEIISFVKEQVSRGEVAFVKDPALEEISFASWIWLLIGVFVLGVIAFIVWSVMDKNKRKLPITIPTHYFEKLVRQEISTHKKERDVAQNKSIEEKKQDPILQEGKKEVRENRETPVGTQTIISGISAIKKKKRKKQKKGKKKRREKKKHFGSKMRNAVEMKKFQMKRVKRKAKK